MVSCSGGERSAVSALSVGPKAASNSASVLKLLKQGSSLQGPGQKQSVSDKTEVGENRQIKAWIFLLFFMSINRACGERYSYQ